jgi:hypothetical protein
MTAVRDAARSNRILRVAVALSLLVHLVLGLLFFVTYDELSRLLHLDRPHPRPKPPPDEIVTISQAIRFDKRPKPVAARPPAHAAPRPPARPRPQTVPLPQAVAEAPRQVVVRQPVYHAPSLLRHELAKPVPRATTQPAITRKAQQVTQTPTAPPHTPAPEKQIASVQHSAAAAQAAAPSRGSKLSDAQLAQIQNDLARTIAQARSRADPLRNVRPEPPAAPKEYRMQMHGVFGNLHRGQGQYYPVRGWRANGLDWYYVSYEFTYADGTYETGSVPWPIHFSPAGDPFVHGYTDVQLPPPPPGFVPPGTLGKALRPFFPNLVFSDTDN